MADYATTTPTIWPSQNDIAATAGNGKTWLENMGGPWRKGHERNYIVQGFQIPVSSGSLVLVIPTGEAFIAGRYCGSMSGTTSVTVTANQTNYLFLKLTRDGSSLGNGLSIECNITGTPPADSIFIGLAFAGAATITETADCRQFAPFPDTLIGGPTTIGAGSTRSHEGTTIIAANSAIFGVHFYTDLILRTGFTWTVTAGTRRIILIATRSITINGTIQGAGAGLASSSEPGTDQPGGGGGGDTGNTGGSGGNAEVNGCVLQIGGTFGAVSTPGGNATQLTGSNLPLADPRSAMGGASGGAGAGGNMQGGAGGASIVLIAPCIRLRAGAVLNTAANPGQTNGVNAGGGGGGAGNVYITAREFTDDGATFTQTGGAGGAGDGGGAAGGGSGPAGFKQILKFGIV